MLPLKIFENCMSDDNNWSTIDWTVQQRICNQRMFRRCLPLRGRSHIQVPFSLRHSLNVAPQLVHHAAISAILDAALGHRIQGAW